MNQYYTPKQQTQYVDDTMRQARVQARKAQQTGGVIPSVKGIRESVSQPTVPTTPTTPTVPTTSSVQTTTSVPTVRPPSVTSPALTNPNGAANIPLSTPKPTANKTYTANVQRANTDILNANKQKATADVWGTNTAPLQTPTPVKASVAKINQTDYTKTDTSGILKPQAPVKDTYYHSTNHQRRLSNNSLYTYQQDKISQPYTSTQTPRPLPRANALHPYDNTATQSQTRFQPYSNTIQPVLLNSSANIPQESSRPHTASLDENGQLLLPITGYRKPQIQQEPEWPSTEKADISVSSVQYTPHNPKLQYSLDQNGQLVRSREKTVPIFKPALLPTTYVGQYIDTNGNKGVCASKALYLTETEQKNIHDMCQLAGVDYYLILATIAHESGSNPDATNKRSNAAGWMQILPDTWEHYAVPGGYYYNRPKTALLRNTALKIGADLTNRYDRYTNAAVGIAHYAEWQKTYGTSMAQVVNRYGQGSLYNPSGDFPILAPSTLEILYYRDLLAQADDQETWYVGILYDKSGNQLSNIDPKC